MAAPEKIKILLVDGDVSLIAKLLAAEPDLVLLGATAAGIALEETLEYEPDILLWDLDLIDFPIALELIKQIRQAQASTAIVCMGINTDNQTLRQLMMAGAVDYLFKPSIGDELVIAIRRAYDLSSRVATAIPHASQGAWRGVDEESFDDEWEDLDDVLLSEQQEIPKPSQATPATEELAQDLRGGGAEPEPAPEERKQLQQDAPKPLPASPPKEKNEPIMLGKDKESEPMLERRREKEETPPTGQFQAIPASPKADEPAPADEKPAFAPAEAPPPPPPPPPPRQPAPAPQAAPGGYFGAASGKPSPSPTQEYLDPQFTAFSPGMIQPKQNYVLLVFVHIDSAIEQVREVAGGFKPMLGTKPISGTVRATQKIEAGEVITFVPQIEGVTFLPDRHKVIWEANTPYQYASFPFTTPASLTADLSGRVLVFKGAIIVGEIPVNMLLVGANSQQEDAFKNYDPIFASYSHRDTPVMEYMRRIREKLGQKMLVDIYDLRVGDHWSDRLLQMIDESAVFQLFWSKHSAESPYCKQEWEHALKYRGQRERFIQPVYWTRKGSVIPYPPPPLDAIQFQHIDPPFPTRAQLLMRRLGRLIGK